MGLQSLPSNNHTSSLDMASHAVRADPQRVPIRRRAAQCGDPQPCSSGSSLQVLDRRPQCDSLLADPPDTPHKKDQVSAPTPMFWDSCSQLVTEGDRVGDGGSRPAHNHLTSPPFKSAWWPFKPAWCLEQLHPPCFPTLAPALRVHLTLWAYCPPVFPDTLPNFFPWACVQ